MKIFDEKRLKYRLTGQPERPLVIFARQAKARPMIAALLLAALTLMSFAPAAFGQPLKPNALLGEARSYVVQDGDTLLDIAIAEDLGYVELVIANPDVDPWVPKVGTELLLPTRRLLPETPHEGIVINLPELRLYYFSSSGGPVLSFPIGIGRAGWDTPVGRTRILRKREHPSWVPPPSIRAESPHLPAVVPPGPNNPLGDHALNLAWPRYVIHGTNKLYGIGRRVSHGCIRLYPADIARLFADVAVGTPVTVVDQPVKLGWSSGELYLEVHPTISQTDEIEASGRFTPFQPSGLESQVMYAARGQLHRLNWPLIRQAVQERKGIPLRITRKQEPDAADKPPAPGSSGLLPSGYLVSD